MIVKEKGKEGSKDAKIKNYERQKGKVEKEREREIKKEMKKERNIERKKGVNRKVK